MKEKFELGYGLETVTIKINVNELIIADKKIKTAADAISHTLENIASYMYWQDLNFTECHELDLEKNMKGVKINYDIKGKNNAMIRLRARRKYNHICIVCGKPTSVKFEETINGHTIKKYFLRCDKCRSRQNLSRKKHNKTFFKKINKKP